MHVHEFAMKVNEAMAIEHKVSIMQIQGVLESIAQDIDIAEHVLSICQSCHGIGLELPADVIDQGVAPPVTPTPEYPHPLVSHPAAPMQHPVEPVQHPAEPVKAPEPVKEPARPATPPEATKKE